MLVPRFSTYSSRPASTAAREHAELMTPLPPMNKILGFAIPQRYWAGPATAYTASSPACAKVATDHMTMVPGMLGEDI